MEQQEEYQNRPSVPQQNMRRKQHRQINERLFAQTDNEGRFHKLCDLIEIKNRDEIALENFVHTHLNQDSYESLQTHRKQGRARSNDVTANAGKIPFMCEQIKQKIARQQRMEQIRGNVKLLNKGFKQSYLSTQIFKQSTHNQLMRTIQAQPRLQLNSRIRVQTQHSKMRSKRNQSDQNKRRQIDEIEEVNGGVLERYQVDLQRQVPNLQTTKLFRDIDRQLIKQHALPGQQAIPINQTDPQKKLMSQNSYQMMLHVEKSKLQWDTSEQDYNYPITRRKPTNYSQTININGSFRPNVSQSTMKDSMMNYSMNKERKMTPYMRLKRKAVDPTVLSYSKEKSPSVSLAEYTGLSFMNTPFLRSSADLNADDLKDTIVWQQIKPKETKVTVDCSNLVMKGAGTQHSRVRSRDITTGSKKRQALKSGTNSMRGRRHQGSCP